MKNLYALYVLIGLLLIGSPAYAAQIGDYVFLDTTALSERNIGDGIQDAGDLPIAYATVELYKVGADNNRATATQVDTQMTDEEGLYQFVDVESGTYFVKFTVGESATVWLISQGFTQSFWEMSFTQSDMGDDALDSDVTIMTDDLVGETDTFVVTEAGQTISSIDAGVGAYIPIFTAVHTTSAATSTATIGLSPILLVIIALFSTTMLCHYHKHQDTMRRVPMPIK